MITSGQAVQGGYLAPSLEAISIISELFFPTVTTTKPGGINWNLVPARRKINEVFEFFANLLY